MFTSHSETDLKNVLKIKLHFVKCKKLRVSEKMRNINLTSTSCFLNLGLSHQGLNDAFFFLMKWRRQQAATHQSRVFYTFCSIVLKQHHYDCHRWSTNHFSLASACSPGQSDVKRVALLIYILLYSSGPGYRSWLKLIINTEKWMLHFTVTVRKIRHFSILKLHLPNVDIFWNIFF